MANENVADIAANMLKCVVASPGQYMETLRQYAGTDTAVLPHGTDWTPVIESADTLGAIINLPLSCSTVGMDMLPPYAVYLNGEVVATHANEQAANELFNKLAGRHAESTPPQ